MDKDRAIRKWFPVLNNVGFQNKKIVEILSIYCEKRANVIDSTSDAKDLSDLASELKKLYESISRKRIEVVKTYYNPFLSKMQYELSNGLIIDEDNKFERDLTQEELIELFGVDFVRELDVEEFRENRLKNLT
jgi:hypothetical protein